MVKTFKNLIFQNGGRLRAESLLKSSGTGGLPKLLNNGCTSLLPYAFVWEKTFKNLSLQNRGCLMAESLHILLGTCACLQWLCHSGERTVARGPLVYNYQRSRSFTDLCPGCLSLSIYNFFSKTAGLIETKLHVEPLWDEGMKVCAWDLGHMTKMAAMLIYGENRLKIFSKLKG